MEIVQLLCNDGGFNLIGTTNAAFDRVDGICNSGCRSGTVCNCRFQMTRQ